jgi:hypothetical protein
VISDNDRITAFVNERLVRVDPGTTALAAVRLQDPALAARIEAGEGYLTDGRGIHLAADLPLPSGAIVRVVLSARRGSDA